jgi:plasmid stability protein
MAELILTNVENDILDQLQMRATRHGRTPAEEAKAILSEALHGRPPELWGPVDAIFHRFAASGRTFSDSAELLREDRNR